MVDSTNYQPLPTNHQSHFLRHNYNVARLVGTRPFPTNPPNQGNNGAMLSSYSSWTTIAYGRLAAILQEGYGRRKLWGKNKSDIYSLIFFIRCTLE